ncbi:hypothetical protein FF2_008093 [Malus domestica]
MITYRILAGFRRRPSHKKHPGLTRPDEIWEIRVFPQPFRPQLVPIRNLGSESVWLIRVELFLLTFIDKELLNIEGVVVVGVRRRRVDLLQDAVGLRPLAGVEVVANLEEVLLRGSELARSDRAAKDDHREDEAEDRDLGVPESSLDPSRSLSSQAFL